MRVGTFLGIPLKVNPFFILLLVVAFFYGRLIEALLLFAVVIWHESAHVLTAKYYRLHVTDIELLPFGGVARMEALLQLNPQIEWVVAIAGPLSNIILIFVGYTLLPYVEITSTWFDFFVQANLGMAIFNLAPVLPLDGGRVLRSILVRTRGFADATRIAAVLGQVLSLVLVGLGVYGIFLGQYNLLMPAFTGIMLFATARQEQNSASYVFMRYLTQKKQEVRLKRVFVGREIVATVETSLGEVLKHFQPPCYHLVWILDLDGRVMGLVSELELISALFEHGLSCKVGALVAHKIL
ncbi:MAG: peptidase M50 [Firmicutes bacterium]|jgi:stage IV sporulation protein FB|nr:peptidase M50 [Bacillota bacterium]